FFERQNAVIDAQYHHNAAINFVQLLYIPAVNVELPESKRGPGGHQDGNRGETECEADSDLHATQALGRHPPPALKKLAGHPEKPAVAASGFHLGFRFTFLSAD